MAYPDYLRKRARELRITKRLSLNELAERLSLPKTTVYAWIADLPLGRPRRENPHPGTRAMQLKYKRLREQAYSRGLSEYEVLIHEPTFRDFVVLYIAEGSKRNRNMVAIGNSDERVIAIAATWMRRLTHKELTYSVQYHAHQDLEELRRHWGVVLGIDGSLIRMQRKSNSGQLNGRTWRSQYGVITLWAADTLLRARLQAWTDRVREDWWLHSAAMRGA
jgi:transcriptional regulator with XRE-family HTH domain